MSSTEIAVNFSPRSSDLAERGIRTIVQTDEDLNVASDLLKAIKALRAEVDRVFDPIIAAALRAHREAIAQKNAVVNPLVVAETTVKSRAAAYVADRDRKAREAREAALRAEIEKRRLEEEALKRAAAAEAAGDTKKADEIIEEAALDEATRPDPPRFTPPAPKTAGVTYRKTWDFEVEDASLLPRQYLIPDLVLIRRAIVQTKGKAVIPGVRAFEKTEVAVSGK